jgi:NADH-quinone oxidoreductase subunit L
MFWASDRNVIDGFGPDGIASRVRDIAAYAVRLQSGYLYHYAFVMLAGIAVFVTIMMMLDRGLL